MAVIQSNVFYVVKRFPDHKNMILKFFRENQNFQTICEDYRRCTQALTQWNQSSSEKAPVRSKEYADLLRELEQEVLRYLWVPGDVKKFE